MRRALLATLMALWVVAGCDCGDDPLPDDTPDASTRADAGGDDDGGSGDGGSGDGGACRASGASCTAGGECCSGTCSSAGFCEAGDGGVSACRPVDETCATGVECCTGRCERDAVGEFRCSAGATCAAAGDSCTVARDCCSLNCTDNRCASEGLCLQTGQACDANDPGACCTGLCSGGVCVKPPASSCTVAGDPCTQAGASSSCCSKVCLDYDPDAGSDLRCGASGVCRAQGETCTEGSDCCSYVCGANGLCAEPPGGGCLVSGSACQALSDCCSGLCANDPTGFSSCEYLGGCRPEGELCRRETDCCGFNATNKVNPVCQLFDVDAGIGRCRVLTGANAPAGEICPNNNSCAPNNDYCLPTIFGVNVKRCAAQCDGGVCGTNNCRGTGAGCQTPDECCSQVCAPQADGGFACAGQCVGLGLSCSANTDCCSGTCSRDAVCVTSTPPPPPDAGTPDAGSACKPVGSTCTAGAECCTQSCNPTTARCESIIIR